MDIHYPKPTDVYHPKRSALCTHISGAESLERPNSVIMGSDMEFKG